MGSVITDKTPVRIPLASAITIILSVFTVVGGSYALRDRMLADIQTSIRQAVREEAEARNEALKRYLTREEFMGLWYRESAKRDMQYSQLLLMLERSHK